MYVAPRFRQSDPAVLADAIEGIRFGTLVTVGDDGPLVTHLPMMLEAAAGPKGTILGHVARANPQWERTDTSRRAIATFVGPSFYVTPSWYPTKRETGKVVPTWSYVAVEARGTVSFFDDRERLLRLVEALTDRQEAGRESPWRVDDAPGDYVAQMLGAIVGFELRIETLEGSWKLGQNRCDADRNGVADAIEAHAADPRVRALAPVIRPD